MADNDTNKKKIKTILESANVCSRCILRFLGEKEYTSYISKRSIKNAIQACIGDGYIIVNDTNRIPASSENDDDGLPVTKKFMPSPCAACLGILQETCDEMICKVEISVAESKHKFNDFVLQVALPVVLDLRDRLFHLYLQEKLGASYSLDDSSIPSVKDIFKWVVGSQFGKITGAEFTPSSDFQILISCSYPDTVQECLVLYENCPAAFPNARKIKAKAEDIYTKSAVLRSIESLSSEIHKLFVLPPLPPSKKCSFGDITCTHSPLYLGGRYNKYSRELSQTPWILDGERKMESSVNELIVNVVEKRIHADKIIFSASGREDVDVRMLGNGRPFVLELINPLSLEWTDEEMKAIEDEINGETDAISVRDLQVISKLDLSLLKEGEEMKKKSYSALCIVDKTLCEEDLTKLQTLRDIKLNQKTPMRVLHRRTLSTREKLIHSIEAKIVSDHLLQIKMQTQAGTYVKEFVHGDFGRTTPNLGTLLNTTADILELDVESIDLDWPPKKIS